MPDSGHPERSCCGKLFTFLFAAGFIILIYWAIFQPHHIRATVSSATLTNLTVAPDNATVSYRLTVGLELYNPSLRVPIYYDALDAELRASGGASLGGPAARVASSPAEFLQRRKSADRVRLEFDGSTGVSVPGDVARELQREAGAGAVSFEVDVDARVRYRFASIKIRQKPRIWCWLTVPVKPEGGVGFGGALASGDRCSVKY
ncbi:hypothetical protein ZWY2020_016823 [Hordeum vulgare]|nr:hypothetical protein ZWY2020_016823 [Hordeum vulgare]